MFAIISIPENTGDVMQLCATRYPHMAHLQHVINLPQRAGSDFKTNLNRTEALVPIPQEVASDYEQAFGNDLVSVIADYGQLLRYMADNKNDWVRKGHDE